MLTLLVELFGLLEWSKLWLSKTDKNFLLFPLIFGHFKFTSETDVEGMLLSDSAVSSFSDDCELAIVLDDAGSDGVVVGSSAMDSSKRRAIAVCLSASSASSRNWLLVRTVLLVLGIFDWRSEAGIEGSDVI